MSLMLEEQTEFLDAGLYREDMLRLLGEHAVTMAHELRSPLNAIAAQVQLLARLLQKQDEAGEQAPRHTERLLLINQEISRMDGLISQYLQLGRLGDAQRTPLYLNQLCTQTGQLLRSLLLSRGQELELRTGAGLTPLYGEEQHIRQVLVNLIVNASDACGKDGHVLLLTQAEPGWQTVAVQDNGPGVPTDCLPYIFDSYYTTKPSGNGLGLHICRRIAQEHGGDLAYTPAPEGGAIFTLRLPA